MLNRRDLFKKAASASALVAAGAAVPFKTWTQVKTEALVTTEELWDDLWPSPSTTAKEGAAPVEDVSALRITEIKTHINPYDFIQHEIIFVGHRNGTPIQGSAFAYLDEPFKIPMPGDVFVSTEPNLNSRIYEMNHGIILTLKDVENFPYLISIELSYMQKGTFYG